MWSQVYDPLGSMALSTIAAAVPVVVLLAALAFFHMQAHLAAGLALVVGVASWARPWIEGPTADLLNAVQMPVGAKEVSLLLVTAAGGLAYVALAFATRAVTLAEVKGLLRRGGR